MEHRRGQRLEFLHPISILCFSIEIMLTKTILTRNAYNTECSFPGNEITGRRGIIVEISYAGKVIIGLFLATGYGIPDFLQSAIKFAGRFTL